MKPIETGRAALELLARGLAEGDTARVEKAPITMRRDIAHEQVKIYEVHDANVTVEVHGLLTNIPASYLYPIQRQKGLTKIKQWFFSVRRIERGVRNARSNDRSV